MPVVDTLRIRLLRKSAIKRLPAPSTAMPVGSFMVAAVAAYTVAGKVAGQEAGVPATGNGRNDAAGRHLPDSVIEGIRDKEIPGGIHSNASRKVQQRRSGRATVTQEAAGL